MTIDIDRLRAIAEAATPGPWEAWLSPYDDLRCVSRVDHKIGDDDICGRSTESDAIHIATFDPPTALALLDEVERLRDWKTSAIEVLGGWHDVHVALGRPGRLGESIAKGVLDHVTALLDRLEAAEATVERVEVLADSWSFTRSRSHDDDWYAERVRAAMEAKG